MVHTDTYPERVSQLPVQIRSHPCYLKAVTIVGYHVHEILGSMLQDSLPMDPLTGAFTRSALRERLAHEVERARSCSILCQASRPRSWGGLPRFSR